MIAKRLVTGIKAAITIGIIWVVISHVDLAPVAARLRHIGALDIVVAILPFAAQQVLWAERWRAICGRLGVELRFVPALQIVTIGMFFNQTLPSAVGGDAMRVWLLVRERVTFGKALSTVLCDRVLALVVLVGLSAATLPLFYGHVGDPHARYGLTAFVAIGAAGFAVFLAFGTQIAHLLRRWKLSRPFGELAHDFHLLFTTPTVTLSLTTWSLAIHVLTVGSAWVIARGLAVDASLREFLVVMPPGLRITMLPV
ncbi:MAG: flippase-like domain-containing protein, partial [Alphaproteobacteria bacterium]|nr:flippase-like domain-containing protein [Alphaproteobacteria bacterium]